MNTVPGQYRKVSVATIDGPLTPDRLTAHFLGREVYRHTQFVVVREGVGSGATALVEVAKEPPGSALFSPVTAVTVRALPHECEYVVAPDLDTAVPSALASAGTARCIVVQGRYDHVSFILDRAPVRVRVADVVPPQPAKLVDQARRVLDLAEDLPPVELVPEVLDMADLARGGAPAAEHYLLPCRASGFRSDNGAAVSFLDERPARADWAQLGCARSRAIHQWFYGDVPAQTVDTCPRRLFPPGDGPTLTKCCLLEAENVADGDTVVVPWGASLAQVKQGLATLAEIGAPAWAPA